MNRQHEASVLIKQYINIANDILRQQKNDFALQGVVALLDRTLGGDDITVQVLDEHDAPVARFTTRFGEGQFAPVRSGVPATDRQFEVKSTYLKQVVDNAEDYMQHPTRLDWDWLTGQVSPVDIDKQ